MDMDVAMYNFVCLVAYYSFSIKVFKKSIGEQKVLLTSLIVVERKYTVLFTASDCEQ